MKSVSTHLGVNRYFCWLLLFATLSVFSATEAVSQYYGYGQFYIYRPSGGEEHTRGESMPIEWSPGFNPVSVWGTYYNWAQILEYSSDGGNSWNEIATVDFYTTYYDWTIPANAEPGSDYFIRIREQQGMYWGGMFNYAGYSRAFTVLRGCAPAAFSAHPRTTSVCEGSAHTFSVSSDMAEGTYEWRHNGNTVEITTIPQYTIPVLNTSHGGNWDVILRNVCDPDATRSVSNVAVLTVLIKPVITQQPQATLNICEATAKTVSVTAVGSSLTYQWQKNGVPITGATASSYTIDNAQVSSAGSYSCIVSGICSPSVTSNATVVTITTPPRITQNIVENLVVCPNTNASLSVSGTGTNLSYQWYKNNEIIPGATSSTYNFTQYSSSMNGKYYCLVTSNMANPSNCNLTTKTVEAVVRGFDTPTVIGSPSSTDVCTGTSTTLVSKFSGAGLSYQWYKNGSPIPNANQYSYTVSNVTPNDAGVYTATATGNCSLTATTAPATLTVISKPTITAHPTDKQLRVGEALSLTVTATDARNIQWYKNGMMIDGATAATYSIPAVVLGDAGYYNAVITNSCGGAASGIARVSVRDPQLELPEITANPSSIVIGEIPVGYDKTVVQTDLLSNTGEAPLQITGLNVSGTSVTTVNLPSLPFTLAPGESQTMSFKATATSIGNIASTLTVISNAPTGNLTLPITAAGVLRYSHNTAQAFDTVLIANVAEKCFTVENTSTMNIVIDQITISGTDASMFTLNGTTTPMALAAGASAQVCVQYTPTSRNTHNALVTFTSSTGGNSTATLSGIGKEPVSVEDGALAGFAVSPNPTTDRVQITLPRVMVGATVFVTDLTGNTVATVGTVSNEQVINWNCKATSGARVASGTYNIVVRTTSDNVYTLPLVIVR